MDYFKALLTIIIGAGLIIFANSIPSMDANINDIAASFDESQAITYGTAHDISIGYPTNTTDLEVAGVHVPYINQIMSFIWWWINTLISIVVNISGYLYSVATLSYLFPSWMAPLFIGIDTLALLCLYKIAVSISEG